MIPGQWLISVYRGPLYSRLLPLEIFRKYLEELKNLVFIIIFHAIMLSSFLFLLFFILLFSDYFIPTFRYFVISLNTISQEFPRYVKEKQIQTFSKFSHIFYLIIFKTFLNYLTQLLIYKTFFCNQRWTVTDFDPIHNVASGSKWKCGSIQLHMMFQSRYISKNQTIYV